MPAIGPAYLPALGCDQAPGGSFADLDLVLDPAENFDRIMKDGVILENEL